VIYVLEVPPDAPARAWFAFDLEDFERKTAAMTIHAGTICIYPSEAEAVGAFEGRDPRIEGKENWRARHALFEQLVALDVLSDDS
jgi:hypothetical protein